MTPTDTHSLLTAIPIGGWRNFYCRHAHVNGCTDALGAVLPSGRPNGLAPLVHLAVPGAEQLLLLWQQQHGTWVQVDGTRVHVLCAVCESVLDKYLFPVPAFLWTAATNWSLANPGISSCHERRWLGLLNKRQLLLFCC